MNFECSDIYFIVCLKPISEEIVMDTRELASCQWMPLKVGIKRDIKPPCWSRSHISFALRVHISGVTKCVTKFLTLSKTPQTLLNKHVGFLLGICRAWAGARSEPSICKEVPRGTLKGCWSQNDTTQSEVQRFRPPTVRLHNQWFQIRLIRRHFF